MWSDCFCLSGVPLLQSTLHAFSLIYNDEEFALIIKLQMFKILNNLLLASPDVTDSKRKSEEAQTPRKPSAKYAIAAELASVRSPTHTSAWALLDLLTTTILADANASSASDVWSCSSLFHSCVP